MPGPPTRAAVVITPQTPVAVTSDPTRLVLRVEADALDLTPPPIGSGLIESIRLGDQPNTLVISLRQASAPRTAITTADNTTRVAMEIPAAVAPAPEISKLPETTPPTTILPRPPDTVQGFTIVIDAGHGGDEVGVRGDGIEEKQLTLDVAHRLRSLVETRLGLRVILTRDDDRTVSIDERASSANNGKADMLVSLHANGAPSGSPAGAEVFFERLDAEGEAVRRTVEAAAISLPVVGGGSRIIDIVPWDLAQARHIGASSMLARVLEEELRQRVPMSDRPLQQGPLRLLSAANMPAALVEMAYLTNAEQAKNARGDEFRNAVAQAVFNAIVRFRGFLEEGNPGAPKPGGGGGAP
jgi:N-acetylmuramoyl-L-alanine amidase